MTATITVLAFVVLLAAGAYALMRSHGRKTAAAYDRRTGRRMIEHVVHCLIEEHGADAPITGQVLDEAWEAGNDLSAIVGVAPRAVGEGAGLAITVYDRTIAGADYDQQRGEPVPTLGDLLDAVRATSLDLTQVALPRPLPTEGASR